MHELFGARARVHQPTHERRLAARHRRRDDERVDQSTRQRWHLAGGLVDVEDRALLDQRALQIGRGRVESVDLPFANAWFCSGPMSGTTVVSLSN